MVFIFIKKHFYFFINCVIILLKVFLIIELHHFGMEGEKWGSDNSTLLHKQHKHQWFILAILNIQQIFHIP